MDVEGLPPDLPPDFQEAPAPEPTTPTAGGEHGQFARRVASVFSTQVTMFALAFMTSLIVAYVFGRDGKGTYAAIVTFPSLLSAFAMMGLPSAVNYFAGRGASLDRLIRLSYGLALTLGAVTVGLIWFAVPWLQGSFLSATTGYEDMVRLILLTVPFSFLSAFGGSILYGRQAVRRYNLIQVGMAALTFVWVVVTLLILHLGIRFAVFGSATVSFTTSVLIMRTVHGLERPADSQPVSMRKIAGYSARTYPASLAGYFSLRADTYILQASLATNPNSAKTANGSYSQAVTMAELLFYVPNAVATLFLPRVAGMTVDESSRTVGRVGRLTTLITLCAGLALIPAAFGLIYLVLPGFKDCLPAFLVLLPGVLSLSVGKVMTSYIAGRGHPGTIAIGSMISVVLNVALNIVFIPAFGIVGASMASLASYSLQAAIAVWFASRLSGQRPLSLFVPGRGEVTLLITTLPRLLHSVPVLNRIPFARTRT